MSESWWNTIPADADAPVEQGRFEIEGADPVQVLEAIVDLGDDMGFLALGRARRDPIQDHDQIIAVGARRSGPRCPSASAVKAGPTWPARARLRGVNDPTLNGP